MFLPPGRISPTSHTPCRNRLKGKLKPPGTPLDTLRCPFWHGEKNPLAGRCHDGNSATTDKGRTSWCFRPRLVLFPSPRAPCRGRLKGKLKPPVPPPDTLTCPFWHGEQIPWPVHATSEIPLHLGGLVVARSPRDDAGRCRDAAGTLAGRPRDSGGAMAQRCLCQHT